jgi:hypothetical protein
MHLISLNVFYCFDISSGIGIPKVRRPGDSSAPLKQQRALEMIKSTPIASIPGAPEGLLGRVNAKGSTSAGGEASIAKKPNPRAPN